MELKASFFSSLFNQHKFTDFRYSCFLKDNNKFVICKNIVPRDLIRAQPLEFEIIKIHFNICLQLYH